MIPPRSPNVGYFRRTWWTINNLRTYSKVTFFFNFAILLYSKIKKNMCWRERRATPLIGVIIYMMSLKRLPERNYYDNMLYRNYLSIRYYHFKTTLFYNFNMNAISSHARQDKTRRYCNRYLSSRNAFYRTLTGIF